MSRQTEKAFRELESFLAAHESEIRGDEDVERLVKAFMDEHNESLRTGFAAERNGELTADDWLDQAHEAPSRKKSLECIRKALELEPENLDAMRMEIEVDCGEDDQDTLRERFSAALSRADEIMAQNGWFDKENIGSFWGLLETRPYMRLRYAYFEALIGCGMNGAAIQEAKEMLRFCENDNLGVRYRLMHLYALMEDEDSMLALHRSYEEYEETQMLLPLSIVSYKTGKMEKAKEYLLRLLMVNADVKKFVRNINRSDLDFLQDIGHPFGYRPFTLEELAMEFHENTSLFISCPGFFAWADRQLSAVKGKPGRKKKA